MENVSGSCSNIGLVYLDSFSQDLGESGVLILPKTFYSEANSAESMPVRLYVNPGETLRIGISNYTGDSGYCFLAIAGYYVNLP